MNLANKLTMMRVVLIPFFVWFLLADPTGGHGKWIALGIVIAASLTDLLDGQIARRMHMVTNFGKFMDPLADKLLVCAAMICFVANQRMPAWIAIVIISREFIISGFRLIAAEQGVVIAAGWWGKFKTAFQMFMVIFMVIDLESLTLVTDILMYIALALTVISLVDYLWRNRGVMKEEEKA